MDRSMRQTALLRIEELARSALIDSINGKRYYVDRQLNQIIEEARAAQAHEAGTEG